ncbi:exported hypothetical protein [Candidatus Sulfopaludibacter sp. SbA3]|nr:exported hypothetical protein [Candidatus Sulfopaludibacter sp. SbA3]
MTQKRQVSWRGQTEPCTKFRKSGEIRAWHGLWRSGVLSSTIVFLAAAAFAADPYRAVDPLAVPVAGDASQAVIELARPTHVPLVRCDLVGAEWPPLWRARALGSASA